MSVMPVMAVPSLSNRIFLLAARHRLQRLVGQWSLQRLGLLPWRTHPDLVVFGRGEDRRPRAPIFTPRRRRSSRSAKTLPMFRSRTPR
jgi:hypothetical protein